MVQLINRYSNAMLALLIEHEELETSLEEARLIRDTLDHQEIKDFLEDPNIPHIEKKMVIKQNFEGKICNHLMGFLDLTIKKSRESIIVPVLTDLIQQLNKELGHIEAYIVTARPLSQEEEASLQRVLAGKLGAVIQMTTSVDPQVLGGFSVLVDGQIFDSTVRTELNRMTERLKRGDYRGS